MTQDKNKTPEIPDSNLPVTLGDFIEQNQKLITVLGVFSALTVFANNIPIVTFRILLSFIFLALALLVWIELWSKKVSPKSSMRLKLFNAILELAIVVIVIYWFLGYIDLWKILIVIPYMFLSTYIFLVISIKSQLYNWLVNPTSTRFKSFKKVIWIVLVVGWIGATIKLAPKIMPYFNTILQGMQQEFVPQQKQ